MELRCAVPQFLPQATLQPVALFQGLMNDVTTAAGDVPVALAWSRFDFVTSELQSRLKVLQGACEEFVLIILGKLAGSCGRVPLAPALGCGLWWPGEGVLPKGSVLSWQVLRLWSLLTQGQSCR